MTQAIFDSGEYTTMLYTPNADVAAGDIIVMNGWPFVAHRDIPAGVQGSLAVFGGKYKLLKNGTSGPAIAVGEQVAWIDNTNLATDITTGNVQFGPCVEDAPANQAYVIAAHLPHGRTTNLVS